MTARGGGKDCKRGSRMSHPRGPNGEKRPGNVVGAAVMVAKIATGELEDKLPDPAKRKAGQAGGTRRAENASRS